MCSISDDPFEQVVGQELCNEMPLQIKNEWRVLSKRVTFMFSTILHAMKLHKKS